MQLTDFLAIVKEGTLDVGDHRLLVNNVDGDSDLGTSASLLDDSWHLANLEVIPDAVVGPPIQVGGRNDSGRIIGQELHRQYIQHGAKIWTGEQLSPQRTDQRQGHP
jgi:hypothetical protein